jgi:hypothetical protein
MKITKKAFFKLFQKAATQNAPSTAPKSKGSGCCNGKKKMNENQKCGLDATDMQNEMIGRQVDIEIPIRASGYETDDELDAVIAQRNARFEQLVGNPELWNF